MSAGHHLSEPDHGHGQSHDHSSHGHGGHHHGHGHHHHPVSSHGAAFAIAVGLNLAFVVIEVGAGLTANSMALLADAGHNFADVLSLLLAWGASVLTSRPPSARFTWGLKGSSILAAMTNAALLWVALGAILLETIHHFASPSPVSGGMMMAVAAAGIAVNGLSALLFLGGSKLDPVSSLVITAIIGAGSWGLLRDSIRLGLGAVPEGIDESAVRAFLLRQSGVEAVHDLHIWPMSTTETALTAHLVMPEGYPGDGFLHSLAREMAEHHAIGHTTIQIEPMDGEHCVLASDAVV